MDLQSLSEDEQERLEKRFKKIERRLDQVEIEGREGYTALKNQNRIIHYLMALKSKIEDLLDLRLPDPPSMDEPDTES